MPALLCISKAVVGKEKFRIRAVQMNNLRGLLGVRRVYRKLNTWIQKLCGVMEWVDESVLWWFNYTERMENSMIAERVYLVEGCS